MALSCSAGETGMRRKRSHARRFVTVFVFVLLFGLLPRLGAAQRVAMSGEYGGSFGRLVNFPLNPPRTVCDPTQSARCHPGQIDRGIERLTVDPLAEPSSGVGVPGAGVRIVDGGLAVGNRFTIPPGAFTQAAGHQFTPVVNDLAIVQLDTTFTYSMPAAVRAVDPAPATRVFQANGWTAPGNGQTGRVSANTTPISAATQGVHNITLRYKAGPNAFGGTMAALKSGTGRLYLVPPIIFSPPGGPLPMIGTNQLGQDPSEIPSTQFGAGWNYTRMFVQPPGTFLLGGGVAPPCTAATPPSPAGCGLVTNFSGIPLASIPEATGTRFMFAWTTGTVEVLFTGTQAGFPADQLLTAMGYDTFSSTSMGGAVRNVGLVAGSYTQRSSVSGTSNGHQVVGLDLRFTPEPHNAVVMIAGVGALVALASGRRKGRPRRFARGSRSRT